MKKLPNISISGTVQELIEVETLLVLEGYDDDREPENNMSVKDPLTSYIVLYDNGVLRYRIYSGCFSEKIFPARDIEKAIEYINQFKG